MANKNQKYPPADALTDYGMAAPEDTDENKEEEIYNSGDMGMANYQSAEKPRPDRLEGVPQDVGMQVNATRDEIEELVKHPAKEDEGEQEEKLAA